MENINIINPDNITSTFIADNIDVYIVKNDDDYSIVAGFHNYLNGIYTDLSSNRHEPLDINNITPIAKFNIHFESVEGGEIVTYTTISGCSFFNMGDTIHLYIDKDDISIPIFDANLNGERINSELFSLFNIKYEDSNEWCLEKEIAL